MNKILTNIPVMQIGLTYENKSKLFTTLAE